MGQVSGLIEIPGSLSFSFSVSSVDFCPHGAKWLLEP